MSTRAIELAKECFVGSVLTHKGEVVVFIEGANWTEELVTFYEAAKRDGMIEMRERAAMTAEEYTWAYNAASSIRALEVTK